MNDRKREDRVRGEQPDERKDSAPPPLTTRQVIGSVLAAMFGVQSQRNRERDFSAGRPGQFIIAGVAMTLLFILIVYGAVHLILSLLQR